MHIPQETPSTSGTAPAGSITSPMTPNQFYQKWRDHLMQQRERDQEIRNQAKKERQAGKRPDPFFQSKQMKLNMVIHFSENNPFLKRK